MGRKFVHDCPFCDVKSTFSLLSSKAKGNKTYAQQSCDNCDEIVSFTFENDEVVDYHPKRSYKSHEALPKEVSQDYVEAKICYDSRAYTASLVMCRRAIEFAALLKGGKGSSLNQLIDSVIPPDLKPLANEIRTWGNIGAHASITDDKIRNIGRDDAYRILDFADKMFWYLFIMPFEIRRSQDKREGNKS